MATKYVHDLMEHSQLNNTNNQQPTKFNLFFWVGGLLTSLLNVFTVPREWKTAWTLALIASLVGLLPQIHLTRCATKMVRPAALVVKIAKTRKDRVMGMMNNKYAGVWSCMHWPPWVALPSTPVEGGNVSTR